MIASNPSSKGTSQRIYWITPAGMKLLAYLDYVDRQPEVASDIHFGEIGNPPEQSPQDPTEAVKQWIISNPNTFSMYMAKTYIRVARDWRESVRWLFEYIWHDKMQRQAMDASIISKADWDAIARWCQEQPDYLDDDRVPPEQFDDDRAAPLPQLERLERELDRALQVLRDSAHADGKLYAEALLNVKRIRQRIYELENGGE